jgi:hypothetical protein
VSTYASETAVSPEKSRYEIEVTLKRYGADQFMYGWDADRGAVRFRFNGKHVAFIVPMPDRNDKAIKMVLRRGTWWTRTPEQQQAALEQAERQRWRALSLVIKAKLEAVESGITTFEDEFLAHLVLPDGQTVGEWMRPQIEEVYATGLMPPRLLGLPAPKVVVEA